ncbi:hypothetical protein JS528_05900 [Bifidobacterium sp. MA2]|uniref:Signal transduction histidine kinase n=1 Tax=Bifidobacterium santillanense TaxID=2809028 RepID=A0ABS5UPL8_9BIFI|nr:hypothetical protein [Bifidobacterium santillanense]MBT1172893.1 hypothetical protein [Bifidobacterium santillanense]
MALPTRLLKATPSLRVRILLATVFSVPVAVQWFYEPPMGWVALALSIAQGIALIGTIPLPVPASITIILIDGLVTICSNGTGPTSTYSIFYALGLLSYMTSNRMAAILAIVACLLQVTYTILPNDWNLDRYTLTSLALFYTIATLIGRALRWREDAFARQVQLSQAEAQLQRTELTAHAAQRMHDAVTGELSFIARMAQRRIREGSDDEIWRQINESALNALDNTHQVIDSLDAWSRDARGDVLPDGDMERQTARLRRVLDDNDRRIARLGFHGRSLLNVGETPTSMEDDRIDLTADFIGELYANIIRHAEPESSYELSIVWDNDGIAVTTSNEVSEEELPRHGQGLRHYRERIERIGGTFTTGRMDDGAWFSFVLIPPKRDGRGRRRRRRRTPTARLTCRAWRAGAPR